MSSIAGRQADDRALAASRPYPPLGRGPDAAGLDACAPPRSTIAMTARPDDCLSWCRPGLRAERLFRITEENTAAFLGGDLPVVGTPVLIFWAEIVASDLLRERSDGRCLSAGARVNVTHRGSAKIGDLVGVTVEVLLTIQRMSRFAITVVHQGTGATILQGEHDRVIVDAPLHPQCEGIPR